MLLGMLSLWKYGGGLPMNAFPPPKYVRGGLYALIPHPIYGGFVLTCGGVAIFFGSSSGLLLVTPSVAMASAALVLGYELPDLRGRFGARALGPCVSAEPNASPLFLCRLRIPLSNGGGAAQSKPVIQQLYEWLYKEAYTLRERGSTRQFPSRGVL
jgi:hypothetical protein